MQKNEIKNFICSFLISLAAVGVVGKVIFHMSEENSVPTEKNKIARHNISLFRDTNETDTLLAEAESINVNSLMGEKIDVSAIEALSAPVESEDQSDLTIAYRNELPVLEVEKFQPHFPKPKAEKIKHLEINTDLSAAQEIQLEASPATEMDVSSAVIALTDMTSSDEEKFNHAPIYEPETDEEYQIAENTSAEPENLNTITADNSVIPLEENTEALHAQIDVLHGANASQIAMLEPNTLVNTIDIVEETAQQSLDEADLKQPLEKQISSVEEESPWVVAESRQEENSIVEDSPWVVARGNKYAKNRAVVEQFAEKEELPVSLSETEVETNTAPAENMTEDIKKEIVSDISEDLPDETDISEVNASKTLTLQEALQPKPLLRPLAEDTKLAYQMIDNLLIPIPEDIKNDANLTPDLSVTPSGKPKEEIKMPQQHDPVKTNKPKEQKELNDEEKESGLFKSIAGWFSSKPEEDKAQDTAKKPASKKKNKPGMTFFQNSDDGDEDTQQPSIMPAELRLSFQPNRAEISGQTLRWIHAFADNARDNDGVFIEIRIDGTSSFALQQKRLTLLSTILANRGVDFRKINIVFTSREPNSLIIRNIRFSHDEEVVIDQNESTSYYRPW